MADPADPRFDGVPLGEALPEGRAILLELAYRECAQLATGRHDVVMAASPPLALDQLRPLTARDIVLCRACLSCRAKIWVQRYWPEKSGQKGAAG